MILTLNFNIRLTLFNLRIFRSGRKIFPMSCCDQNKEELVNILTGFSSFVNKISISVDDNYFLYWIIHS